MAEGAGRNPYERNQIEEAINHLLLQLLKEGDHAESSKILQIPIQWNLDIPEMTTVTDILMMMATDHPKTSEAVEEATEETDMGTVDTTRMTAPMKSLRTLIIHDRHPEKESHLEGQPP